MKVHFQRSGNVLRKLFISFEVFDQIQRFVSPIFNTSTYSDESSKSEPRPINHWRVLFKYSELFFLVLFVAYIQQGSEFNLKKKKLILMHVSLLA